MTEPFVCPCWANVAERGWRVLCGRPGCEKAWRRRQDRPDLFGLPVVDGDRLRPTVLVNTGGLL